ncbi:hypothetical protein PBY51_005132 [Eleginops maclovinus]|uniref:Uncharacterized protein n=1 Tax=Eleginops maclovinus TaxID=56733 RepID=A0AAN7X2I6_ELEMC|nr:hypothetical protein PBY51_005132 [Eleginops maclovinus]
MNPSPDGQIRPRGAVLVSSLVVVNMIWWMLMIAAIGLGLTHLKRCPVEPNIPIYLIVLGATSLLSLSLTYTMTNREGARVPNLCSVCICILYLFSFSWFIAGSIWIYPVYPPNYIPGIARYCHMVTYQFAFVITTLVWVVTMLMFVCGCCFAVLTCCQTVIAGSRLVPSRYSFYGATSDFQEPIGGDV